MNILKKIASSVLSFISEFRITLNSPDEDSYTNLTHDQFERILSLVDDEVEVSRGYGLIIRPEDIIKEKGFWLSFVNIVGAKKIYNADRPLLWRLTYDLQMSTFSNVIDYYRLLIANSNPRITSSENAYECHLHSLQATILRTVDNDSTLFPKIDISPIPPL